MLLETLDLRPLWNVNDVFQRKRVNREEFGKRTQGLLIAETVYIDPANFLIIK